MPLVNMPADAKEMVARANKENFRKYRLDKQWVCSKCGTESLLWEGEDIIHCSRCDLDEFYEDNSHLINIY